MGRLRAIGYGAGVSLVVFAYLALPLLRELYGRTVNFPVYGGLALFAGFLTYVAVRRIQAYAKHQDRDTNEVLVEGEVYRVGDGEETREEDGEGDRTEVDVEMEMEQLRTDE